MSIYHLRRAVASDSLNANYYNTLGEALRKVGEFDESLQMFNEVLRISPKFIAATFNKAFLYQDMSNIHMAIQLFEEVAVSLLY